MEGSNEKYEVLVDRRVVKFFRHLLPKHATQLKSKLEALGDSPFPQDYKKLHAGGYRVTVGEYRILYTVDDSSKTVKVFEIIKRNDLKYRF